MKRLLTIALWMLTCIVASAQERRWYIAYTTADELKGETAHKRHVFVDTSQGTFSVNNWDDLYFAITSQRGNLDVWRTSDGIYYVSAIVGLYSLDGKLEEKVEAKLVANHLDYTCAYLHEGWGYGYSARKKIKKMKQALKNGTGKVRVVIDKRNGTSFDITVSPYVESEALLLNK